MANVTSYQELVKEALARVAEISPEALAPRLNGSHGAVILDVREPAETRTGILPGAVLLPRGIVEKNIAQHVPSSEATVYVYCATGQRSALVADVLQRMGYANVFSVAGGIEAWRHRGLPLAGDASACPLPGRGLSWDDVRREFAIVSRGVPVLGSGERPVVYLDHAA